MRERYFWAAIALIVLSWGINSLYAQSKQLEEPIFLNHYIETTMGEHTYINFYYLTNKNDTSRISHVNLGELTGYVQNDYFHTDLTHQNIDTYRHHGLRSVAVHLRGLDVVDENLSFKEIDVFYSNGNRSTVPIGEVIIRPPNSFWMEPHDALTSPSSGSSNDGSSWSTFTANEPLTIEEISFPFDHPIEDYFSFSIPGQVKQPLDALDFPIQLEKNKSITLRMNLNEPHFVNAYFFFAVITGTTETGASFTDHAGYVSDPYLTQEDVNRIIEEQTGRDSSE